MPVNFECGKCSQKISIAGKYIGMHIKCPACQADLMVPNPNGTSTVTEVKHQRPVPPPEPQSSFQIKPPEPLPEESYEVYERPRLEPKGEVTSNLSVRKEYQGNLFMDFMSFKIMITPVLIKIMFGFVLLISALAIIGMLFPEGSSSHGGSVKNDMLFRVATAPAYVTFIFKTIGVLVFLMFVRIFCEFMIVLFCINGKISDLQNNQ